MFKEHERIFFIDHGPRNIRWVEAKDPFRESLFHGLNSNIEHHLSVLLFHYQSQFFNFSRNIQFFFHSGHLFDKGQLMSNFDFQSHLKLHNLISHYRQKILFIRFLNRDLLLYFFIVKDTFLRIISDSFVLLAHLRSLAFRNKFFGL